MKIKIEKRELTKSEIDVECPYYCKRTNGTDDAYYYKVYQDASGKTIYDCVNIYENKAWELRRGWFSDPEISESVQITSEEYREAFNTMKNTIIAEYEEIIK